MGGLIGHSTGHRSLSTVGGTHVCPPQRWKEIDAHVCEYTQVINVSNFTLKFQAVAQKMAKTLGDVFC